MAWELNNGIWIKNNDENDKPIKLVFENNNYESNIRKRNKEEIKRDTIKFLKELLFQSIITTQQFRSEKGKIKRNQFEETLKFIKKVGYEDKYSKYIEEDVQELIIKKKILKETIGNEKFGGLKIGD